MARRGCYGCVPLRPHTKWMSAATGRPTEAGDDTASDGRTARRVEPQRTTGFVGVENRTIRAKFAAGRCRPKHRIRQRAEAARPNPQR